jgi:glycerol-3-phosphate O-acyltransferase
VGSVLRRGGAFFIRRSFQGDALYAAVFRGYFRTILARGFPVEYFVEGTRSRTGRLLTPKLGMLTMTAEAFLVDPARSIVFVPVYFGYEKLLEGQSFVGELRGQRKRKETLTGFLRSLKALRGRFGRVQVSFGAPIALADVLDRERPDWRDISLEEPFRPEWLTRAVRSLGDRIMTSINEAAQINSVNLVSLVTLCMPKQAIVEVELKTQLDT